MHFYLIWFSSGYCGSLSGTAAPWRKWGDYTDYKAFKLSTWHSLSNWIAKPWEVERTILPVKPFNLFTSLSFLMLSVGMVKSRINRVPSGKDVNVVMNVPEAEMSLVTRSKTFFLPVVMALSLTGSGKGNLSYWRLSFIDNAFLCQWISHLGCWAEMIKLLTEMGLMKKQIGWIKSRMRLVEKEMCQNRIGMKCRSTVRTINSIKYNMVRMYWCQ